jgi:hypothetical protein
MSDILINQDHPLRDTILKLVEGLTYQEARIIIQRSLTKLELISTVGTVPSPSITP